MTDLKSKFLTLAEFKATMHTMPKHVSDAELENPGSSVLYFADDVYIIKYANQNEWCMQWFNEEYAHIDINKTIAKAYEFYISECLGISYEDLPLPKSLTLESLDIVFITMNLKDGLTTTDHMFNNKATQEEILAYISEKSFASEISDISIQR